jgi:diguanylate cyclase (GGDEF)-like protein
VALHDPPPELDACDFMDLFEKAVTVPDDGTALQALSLALDRTENTLSRAFITDLIERLRAQHRDVAERDALTGCFNRVYLSRAWPLSVQVALAGKSILTLALVDLNGFKKINDQYGHRVGDTILEEWARDFSKNVPTSISVGRWGGDEFYVFFTADRMDQVQQKLTLVHKAACVQTSRGLSMRATIGAITRDYTDADIADLNACFDQADAVLRTAKRAGVEFSLNNASALT